MITVDIKALISHLNEFCKTSLENSAAMCVARNQYEVTAEHMIKILIDDTKSQFFLLMDSFGADLTRLRTDIENELEELAVGNSSKPVFSPRIIEWFQEALLTGVVNLNEDKITSGSLLFALIKKGNFFISSSVHNHFKKIDSEIFLSNYSKIYSKSSESKTKSRQTENKNSVSKSALAKYCENFTFKAEEGLIDPVFGRDSEIRQVIDILARRRKNNPIVVGEAGVGKTAVIEGLALRIVEGDVPDFLKEVSIYGLDMGLLQAGAGVKGEFENRLKNVLNEVKSSINPIILFIDEAHTMIGAGGAQGGSDAANLLKPALARGELRTIAATTWSEYKKYFEKDAALARRFQLVHLEEPSVETAVLILRGLKEKYETSHGVIIQDDAIVAAAEMSSKFISGRYLPDKAIDLLDTSAARVKVLLTAKPSCIEDIERKLQAFNREKKAIERDAVYGHEISDERLETIKTSIQSLDEKLELMVERWEKERKITSKLIELRQKFYMISSEDYEGEELEEIDELIKKCGGNEYVSNENYEDELVKLIKKYEEDLNLHVAEYSQMIDSEVSPEIISMVVSDWTGIPAGKIMSDEAETIINLENKLSERVKGQSRAIETISSIIRSSKAGLGDPEQPAGVFLLAGPSGVGKTETGLAIADYLFGGERSAVTINMSEFQEKHTVSRLIGSPPGYVGYGEGGILTEAVRQRPYSAVLLDEVEKADSDVMNLFYQVFDKGILSDGEGRKIDFKNSVVFMTSNLGAETIQQLYQADESIPAKELVKAIKDELGTHFKPALLARMTIVPYIPLNPDTMEKIVKDKIDKIVLRIFDNHKIHIDYSEDLISMIASRCIEVDTGARNIDHILKEKVMPVISNEILEMISKKEDINKITLEIDNSNPEFSVAVSK